MDTNTIVAVGVDGFLVLFFIYALYDISKLKYGGPGVPEPVVISTMMTEADVAEEPTPEVDEAIKILRVESSSIIDVEGIGPVYSGKLNEVGIRTTNDLLEAGATRRSREALAKRTGISRKLILEWVNIVDLFRIRGIGEEYSDLLEEAGVDTVVELATRNPQNLHTKIREINEEKNLVRRTPSLGQVEDWVEQAKELPRKVTY